MQITELKVDGYERVVSFADDLFQCYVAIHNTNLGPALGGCRIKSYPTNEAAMLDAIRLAKGMTYKSSLAGLNLGGGKTVVSAPRSTREIMLKVGECVNYFKGDYITGEDMGTTLEDMHTIYEVSPYATHEDSSTLTAKGVLLSMEAALEFLGEDSLPDVPVWVQGLGKVGFDLVNRIVTMNGATRNNIYVNDIRSEIVEKVLSLGAHEINDMNRPFMMIYAPCAMGQVVNPDNFQDIRYPIICGAANNQLVNDDEYAEVLKANNVLFCPDWLVNAGGVIGASCAVGQEYDEPKAEAMTDYIGVRMTEVLSTAKSENKTPLRVAKEIAEARFMG